MRWWLRVLLVRVWGLALACCLLLAGAAGGGSLPVPSLFSHTLLLRLPFVYALVPACLLLTGVQRTRGAEADTSVRLLPLRTTLLVAVSLAATVLVGWRLGELLHWPLELAAARDIVGYVGLGLLAGRFAGWQTATVAPVAFMIVCALVGTTVRGPRSWAWPLAESASGTAAAWAAVLLLMGLAASFAIRVGPQHHPRE